MTKSFKRIIGKLHLWLGMATGVVIFIVSITGAVYVFEEEINILLQSGVYKTVKHQKKPILSPLEIEKSIKSQVGDSISYMNLTVFPNSNRANIVWIRDLSRKYIGIAQNPYTGDIVQKFSYNVSFWAIILGLHTSLLIPEIGNDIVNISTIVFVFLLISGLYLWFPKQNRWERGLTIKWSAKIKRLNYDFHNVLGFYATWIAIFLAITGLVMSYQWMALSVYWLTSGFELPKKNTKVEIVLIDSTDNESLLSQSFENIFLRYGDDIKQYFVVFPTDSTSPISLTVNTKNGFWLNRKDEYLINPDDGRILNEKLYKNKTTGNKVLDANLNIHTGSILGITGKIVVFFISLISASLPITGFYVWWWRRKRKRKKT